MSPFRVVVALGLATFCSAAAAQLISMDDYPLVAVREHHEGDVLVGVTVGVDGRAHNCIIVKSSGHAELDQASCRIMLARARFKPAKDAAGNLTEDKVTQAFRWRLQN